MTSLTLDASGNKTADMRYKAWGEVRYANSTLQTDRTYTGQRSYSDDFGLMFYNARWYDSSIGHFAQADNIDIKAGDTQSLDRFTYGLNNPSRYTDPSGHSACDQIPAGSARDACNNSGYGADQREQDAEKERIVQALQKWAGSKHGKSNGQNASGAVTVAALIFGEGFSQVQMETLTSLAEQSGLNFSETTFWWMEVNATKDASGSAGNIAVSDDFFNNYSTEEQIEILREEFAHGLQNVTEVGKDTVDAMEEQAKGWAANAGDLDFMPMFLIITPGMWNNPVINPNSSIIT